MSAAFVPKKGANHLSVNWLEFFGSASLDTAIDQVREAFGQKGYRITRNGRFAAIHVGTAKRVVREAHRCSLSFKHLPAIDDKSHAGILGYDSEDFAVAVELKSLVKRQDVHQATS